MDDYDAPGEGEAHYAECIRRRFERADRSEYEETGTHLPDERGPLPLDTDVRS